MSKEYFDIKLDSSSSLKLFSQDRRKYYKRYYQDEKIEEEEPDSKASIIGNLVECLLLEPELYEKLFYTSSIDSTPTGNMLLFVEALYKAHRDHSDENGNLTIPFSDIARIAYKESGYKWTFEKVLEKFSDSDAEIYFQEIKEVRSKGLTVITLEDYTNAKNIVNAINTNKNTRHIFNIADIERFEVFNQLKITGFSIDGLFLKSMLDRVVVDHEKKEIIPYDLKCVWAVEQFYKNYYLYRNSYIQAYLYDKALNYWKKFKGYKEYTVELLKFVVVDSINYYEPLIYTLNTDDLEDAYKGFTDKSVCYKGVKEIIEELKWAKETDTWRISKKNSLKNGILNIKDGN